MTSFFEQEVLDAAAKENEEIQESENLKKAYKDGIEEIKKDCKDLLIEALESVRSVEEIKKEEKPSKGRNPGNTETKEDKPEINQMSKDGF